MVKQRELLAVASTSSIDSLECLEKSDEEQLSNSKHSTQILCSEKSSKRGKKSFVTTKLVAALDRCQLSIRDSVYILYAVV
ncbi:hypothetical protein WA026_002807 [Henosepilachna vigintioctopunctata]|uniref:Uncharacterized protein n=1 Tax=Henosepilachna vigintioctopunctata TaxID=420089 RepID=A0AAW1U1E1_9CUCU